MPEQHKYESKPLEGVIWMDEKTFKARDGREFTVMKGKLLDEHGKAFYIDAYVNFTKNGKKLLSLKLKSVDDAEREKALRQSQGYTPQQQPQSQPQDSEIRIEDIPF